MKIKIHFPIAIVAVLGMGLGQALWAQTPTEEPTVSEPVSLRIEEQKLEIEKLKLEKDNLNLEMQKMQLQATQTVVPAVKTDSKHDAEEIKNFQAEASQKAEELATANKDKENLLVLDLVNGEMWNKGVRYSVHELYAMAEDRGWKITKKLDEMDAASHERYLYKYRNLSLLRYENRDRGIFIMTAPKNEGDFDFLTADGISFASATGAVRNTFQSVYFTYDREVHDGPYDVLRYNHGRGLAFSDKLEIYFDREGKMAQLKYGVLDER